MRLIDADALIPMMKYATTDSEIGVFPIKIGFNEIEKVINEQPTIEPEPQRTGRWIDHAEEGYVECPFCHSATNCDGNMSELHFCFSCGARMEENNEAD
jgi:hypothetical protein